MITKQAEIKVKSAQLFQEGAFTAALSAAKSNLILAEARVNTAQQDLHAAKSEVTRLRQLVDLLDAQINQGKHGSNANTGNTTGGEESKRASVVFNNVVRLFRENPKTEFTVEDLSAGLAERGICDESKAIHNVLGYLMRQGRLRRVSRGRYYLPEYGVGVEMGEE